MGKGKTPERQLEIATVEPAFDPDTAGEIFEPVQPEVEEIPETSNASPLPEPTDTVSAEVSEHETIIELGDRRYRVRGISKIPAGTLIWTPNGKVAIKTR